MDDLIINGTDSSLHLHFDVKKNDLLLSGESRPENCSLFFNPILQWIKEYKVHLDNSPHELAVKVKFKLDYFNSTSAKFLTDFFLVLKEISKLDNVDLLAEWHYKSIDEEILESGQDFQEMTDLKLAFKPFD
jgi:hypothetical protein